MRSITSDLLLLLSVAAYLDLDGQVATAIRRVCQQCRSSFVGMRLES